LVKNSFTLFETLLSITILSIVISGFIYSTYSSQNNHEIFQTLNTLENKFDTKEYGSFTKTSKLLTLTINDTNSKTITVNKYEYKDENIKIFKYEK